MGPAAAAAPPCLRRPICTAARHRQGPSLSRGPGHPVCTPSTVLVTLFIQIYLHDGFPPQISSFQKTVSISFTVAINNSWRTNKSLLQRSHRQSLVAPRLARPPRSTARPREPQKRRLRACGPSASPSRATLPSPPFVPFRGPRRAGLRPPRAAQRLSNETRGQKLHLNRCATGND